MLKNSEFYETLVDGIGEGINKPKPKADFDENDPENPGYIKNRTHWKEEIPKKNIVIAEGTQPSGNAFAVDKWALSEHLVAGVTYKMTVNGYTYSVVAENASAGVTLSLMNGPNNSIGSVYEQNKSGKLSFSGSPSGNKEFKIELNEPAHTVYHPIDANYLPQNRTTYTVVIDENSDTGDLELSKDTPWEDLVKAYEDGCNLVLVDARTSNQTPLFYNFLRFDPNMEAGMFVFTCTDFWYQNSGIPYGVIASISITKTTDGVVQVIPEEVSDLITSNELFCRVDVIDTSGGNYRCDPDFNTIYNWCESGKNVYCYCDARGYGILPLDSFSDSNIIFEGNTTYYGGISRRTIEINSDGTANVSQMFFGYLPGISNTPKSISAGQTIVAKHIQSGVNLVDQWEAADIVRPSTIGDLSDLTTESKGNLVAAINEVKAGGGSGGASVQSDWNQNDETAADYVKNRICYKEEIPEQHATLCENVHVNNMYQANDLADISEHLQVGITYVVNVDGYISTAIAYDANAIGVGLNLSNSSGGIGMIFEPNSSGKISWSGRPNLDFTFSISRDEPSRTVYHKIDSNYLPSEVFWVKITQDEDGNVTSDKTPAEIAAAYEAGYAVYAKYSDIDRIGILSLSAVGGLSTLFTGTVAALGAPFRALVACINDAWSAQFSPLDNVVTELSASSTDNEVPSAKCVYDTLTQGTQYALSLARQLGISDAKAGQLAKIKAVNDSGNPISWEAVDMPSATDLSLGLTSASVGQIIKVKAVDEDGKPTEWETAEMDEDFELINEVTVAEDVGSLTISVDKDGNPFELKEAAVLSWTVPFAESTNNFGRGQGFTSEARWGHYIFPMANSIPAGQSNVIGRYDLTHVKVVNGYIMQMGHWESQNTGNSRSVLQKNNSAMNAPFNLYVTDDEGTPTLANPQGNITCYKIVGYSDRLVSAGSVIRLYGKRA